MADARDEALLREIWNPAALGDYEGRWIAFSRGEVVASAEDIFDLLAQRNRSASIRDDTGPLYAFVTFGIRA